MKAKKHWNRRVLSFLLALAMVVTQLGVWNVGKESVQAAEDSVIYSDDMENDADENWDVAWKTLEGVTVERSANQWAKNNVTKWWVFKSPVENQVTITRKIQVTSGSYIVSVDMDGGNVSGNIQIREENNTQSKELLYGDWDNFKTTTDTVKVENDSEITIQIRVDLQASGWFDLDNFSMVKALEDDNDTDNSTEYNLQITADNTTVEAGDTVTLTAVLKKGQTEITDLEAAGLHLYWWNNTTGSSAEFINYDDKNGYALTLQTTLGTTGTNEIQAKLQDANWNDIAEKKIELTVNEASNSVKDAPIAVTKVNKLSSDFIMGMDISSMISELESGVVYRDYDGNELATLDDICRFIKEQGINHIRVRVWNNPYDANGNGYGGGNNDVAKAKEFADACRNAGLKMLVDFHCSDLWTDPSKQQEPKAWKGYTLEQKKEALNTYITESLNTIDPSKDVVDMVQVGNETTGGFIGETNVSNMCVLFSAGAAGVETYNPDVKVVIHVESPHKRTMVTWAENLQDNNVNYDILATSYYPYWHGTLDNLKQQFETVKNTYCKDVMVAETSYAYTLEDSDGHANTVRVGNNDNGADTTEPFTEQGQATAIRNLINTVNEAGGLGVYYWEPAWLTVGNTKGLTGDAYNAQVKENQEKWEKYGSGWASSYANEYDSKDAGKWYGGSAVDNEAMFYPDGTATPALHVWNYVKTGAVSNLVSVEGFDSALTQTITAGSDFTLPDSVEVTYSDSKTPVAEAVTWDEASVKKADMSKPGTYQISGTVSLSKEITRGAYKGKTSVDVTLTLQVKYANLITNKEAVEFDSGEYFTVDGTTFKGIPSAENAKSGKNSMGWYGASAANGSVTYKKAITLEKGTYTLEAYAQGAQSDVTMQILNAEDDSVLFTGEATAMTAWGDWHTPKVTFTLDKTKSVKLRVCVEHEDGGWGAVDVLYLHKDASSSEGKDDTNTSGSSSSGSAATVTPSDDTKKDDKPEQTTESKNVTATTASGEKAEITVTVTKDTAGKVTEASAEVTGTKAEISADMVRRIVEAAGTDHVAITANVTDKEGNIRYTVTADAKDLTAGKKLSVVVVDKKTGAYKLVNAKTYTVGKDGTLHVNLAAGSDYRMLSAAEIKNVEKAVLKTVAVKKTTASIKAGKNTKIQLSSKLDLDNVKKITYTSGEKSVAAVDKNGKITAKKKGTVTIKAKVTLKNGKTKTVSMKIKVK
jgi:arabinogalactan endo-1,4-beta-galactosidase